MTTISRRAALLALGGILLVALALRLWHIRHGLPFAYNADEAEHFVPKAVGMFDDGLDPGYYENPSGSRTCSSSSTPSAGSATSPPTRSSARAWSSR